MRTDRIDFISAYCDSWCERCDFTMRCSHYAVKVALPLCDGDTAAAIDLAVGRPAAVGSKDDEGKPAWWRDLPNEQPTEAEMAEFGRAEEARAERLDESPLTTAAEIATTLAYDWLQANDARLRGATDSAVREAREILAWDCGLIAVKIHRALRGRDEANQGEWPDDDPVQNDWNGSAKVALISIERSAAAWRVIAEAIGDDDAAYQARLLDELGQEVERAFPNVRRFLRPGFDEPGR